MDQALKIAELVALIVEAAVPNGGLLSLLVVNRFFFSTVLPYLWAKLYSNRPLLALLPGTFKRREIPSVQGVIIEWIFDAETLSADVDWTRLEFYAPLVRTLTWGISANGLLSSAVDMRLSTRREQGMPALIFPNLTDVALLVQSSEDEKLSALILSGPITSIQFHWDDRFSEYPPGNSAMPNFVQNVPISLTEFTLRSPDNTNLGHIALAFLRQSPQLVHLTVDSYAFISIITQVRPISNVTSLYVEVRGGQPLPLIGLLSQSRSILHPFPNLRSVFGISSSDVFLMWKSLLPVIGAKIEEIEISPYSSFFDPSQIADLLQAAGSYCLLLRSLICGQSDSLRNFTPSDTYISRNTSTPPPMPQVESTGYLLVRLAG